jgi:tripartite-type tricarboxylate transporter receptor subunit TctC
LRQKEEDAVQRLLALLFLVLAGAAAAQDFPNRPVKLVVPYAAGGLPDTMMRILGVHAAEFLGQQIIVENRGGAGGIAGSEAVAKSTPDGYTLLVADVGQVAINPHIFSRLPYDPEKDFTPVTLIGTSTLFLCLHPSVPASNFREFVAYVKANPGKVNYGSSGVGSIHHLATEALKVALGLQVTHVPYKGMGQAVPALISGEVTMLYSALPAIESYVKSGKLKYVAVSTAKRSPQAPEVPTVAELGVAGYDFSPEIGILAPAGTPAAVVQKLATELAKAAHHPDTDKRFTQLGIDVVGSTPQEYAARIRAADRRYAEVARVAGVKAD